MSSRVAIVLWSPRVAPGLFSAAAWTLLREADAVLVESPDHPHVAALAAQGIRVEVSPGSTARERGLDLVARTRDDRAVIWLTGSTGDDDVIDELAALVVADATGAGQSEPPEIEVVVASWDVPGARLLDAVAVMDTLRSPGGCAWDAEQTHRSLAEYLLEESYEVLEVIESGDHVALREELGDLLLQVLFHSRIASEDPEVPFDIDDVAAGIVAKLISRHPHVFGTGDRDVGPATVEANWEAIKRAEKGRTSALDGVPLALPALALSAKLQRRAARFDVSADIVPADLRARAVAATDGLDEGQLGQLLHAMVAAAGGRGVDAESALRATAARFADAVRAAEAGSKPG